MPLQHAGLAALYGADFQKDPGQFDPDVARQIERGLSLRGLEVAAGLGASAAIRAAFAEFFCEFDLLLAPTVPCVAWPLVQLGPKMIDGKDVKPSGSRRLHAFRQSRTPSGNFNPLRPRRERPAVRNSDHRAKRTRPDVAACGNAH